MKVIVIGATGTLGRPVVEALEKDHEVVRVSRNGDDRQADLADSNSLRELFQSVAPFDAVVSVAGAARFKPMDALTDEDFAFSLANKLMGQVNVVRIGAEFINDGGSFTLTGGSLAHEPMEGSAAVSLVNAALEGFARAAALELRARRVRVNVVSPPWIRETLEAMGRDATDGLPAAKAAEAYALSVKDSARSGEVIDARLPTAAPIP